MTQPLSDSELHYFYFGLHTALKRYRFATIVGWIVVALGVASVPLGWEWGRPHGLLDLALSLLTIFAGLTLVQQSVVYLESYLHVPFPLPPANPEEPDTITALPEIKELMNDIDMGGWQEAYTGISRLKEIGEKHQLPPPDRGH